MNVSWFLVIFLFTGAPSDQTYLDKVSVPMTGKLEQLCRQDATGVWRYQEKLEGMDNLKVLTACVPFKQWRPS